MPGQKKKKPTKYFKLECKSVQYTKKSKMQKSSESEVIFLGFI